MRGAFYMISDAPTADAVALLQILRGKHLDVARRLQQLAHGLALMPAVFEQQPAAWLQMRERVPEITAVRDATDHSGGEKPYYSKTEGRSALG